MEHRSMIETPGRHQSMQPCRRESGAVLVEFALISLLMYILLAATIDLGRLFLGAQVVQDAARTAARELSVVPLTPQTTFDQAFADPRVLTRVYDPERLVIDLDTIPSGTLDTFFAGLPAVNKVLRPLMVQDRPTIDGVERNFLRFPGTIVRVGSSGFTVIIPRIVMVDGMETIEWAQVLEEIRPDPDDASTGSFSLFATGAQRGLAAVRINYPFQAATLTGLRGGSLGMPIEDDPIMFPDPPLPLAVTDTGEGGANAGTLGLGRQFALGRTVRPWRKLLAGQMLHRREVYR